MRVFLSAYSGFTLAVPMDSVAAMMLPELEIENIMQYDQQSRNTFVSLPRLFNLPNEVVAHGIVLREWNSKVNKVVLLTAEIKRDIEIPDEEFHPIPKSLGALRFSQLFSGIQFSGNPVLLLNIEQLAEVIQKEQQAMVERKNRPVIEEEIEPPVKVEEKKPPVIVEEKKPPVTIEEKKPPVPVEEVKPQIKAEEKKPPVIEKKIEPQIKAEEKNPQITINEENVSRILIKESEPQIVLEEIKQPIING